MQSVPAQTNYTIPFAQPSDGKISSAKWRLIQPSNDGAEISDWIALDVSVLTTPGETINVTTSAEQNTITTVFRTTKDADVPYDMPNTSEGRIVELYVTYTNIPAQTFSGEYFITANDGEMLVLMQNSFQTYVEALGASVVLPNLTAWSSASPDERKQALISAYANLSRLNYEIYYDSNDIYFRDRASWGLPYINTIGRLYNYNAADFMELDPNFIQRIREAQVIEANSILDTNSIEAQREDGLISKKVGEEQHVYRNTAPFRLGISREAARHIGAYLKNSVKLVRS